MNDHDRTVMDRGHLEDMLEERAAKEERFAEWTRPDTAVFKKDQKNLRKVLTSRE